MAEGLARALWGGKARVQSAGSHPAGLNPLSVQVMAEIGIDISRQRSKSVREIDLPQVDLVITLCKEEVCPVLPPGKRHLHWPISDVGLVAGGPEERIEAFRQTRDLIRRRLKDHTSELIGI